MTVLTRIAALTNYVEVAQHLGLNPYSLMSQHGLRPALLENPDNRVSSQAIVNLLEESSRLSGCPTFGLRMAESRQLSDFGALSLLITHQPTLRDALNVTLEHRHQLNEALVLHLEESGKTAIVRAELVTDSLVSSRQATELAIGVLHRLCAALLGAHWHPRSASFTHAAPDDLGLHRRLFGCKLEFESEFNGIVFLSSDLDVANPYADQVMAQHARRYIDTLAPGSEESLAVTVRRAIYLLLPMGRANIEQIAQSMGMNVRTLQRRLEEDGETFSTLINRVRHDLAERYMENLTYSLGRIADLLGYSTPSSFTRWFISQFDKPPALWRRERQKDRQPPT